MNDLKKTQRNREAVICEATLSISLKGNRWNLFKALLRPSDTLTLQLPNCKIGVKPAVTES